MGTESPFRVPEGYFENLTSEVMKQLPEKETPAVLLKEPTRWQKIRPWLYMTAMFIGAALIIRIASSDGKPAVNTVASEDTDVEEIEYINTVLDNSMMDDYSLYVYLADAQAE